MRTPPARWPTGSPDRSAPKTDRNRIRFRNVITGMESGATSVDPQALRSAAHRLDAAAELLRAALSGYLRALRFDADAGMRAAVDQLVDDVAWWQRAARETAVALRTSADHFIDTETRAAQALR